MIEKKFKVDVLSLGISQIYLNKRKLEDVEKWFNTADNKQYDPLPVYDFGNGRYILTDGHSRAFMAYKKGLKEIWVQLDTDEIVIGELGQLLYKNAIVWCDRYSLNSVADLEHRIITDDKYQILWIKRCERMYHLIVNKDNLVLSNFDDLYLYGVDEDLSVVYYENNAGLLYKMINDKMLLDNLE